MDQSWCLPRSLLRASPEGRGHVVPHDRGAVVSRPDGRDGSRQPWRRQPQRPRSDPESLRRAHESSQGELLWKLLAQAPRCRPPAQLTRFPLVGGRFSQTLENPASGESRLLPQGQEVGPRKRHGESGQVGRSREGQLCGEVLCLARCACADGGSGDTCLESQSSQETFLSGALIPCTPCTCCSPSPRGQPCRLCLGW